LNRQHRSKRKRQAKQARGDKMQHTASIDHLKKYLMIFLIGAAGYASLEKLFRGFTHWSMFFTGGIVLVILYYVNSKNEKPRFGRNAWSEQLSSRWWSWPWAVSSTFGWAGMCGTIPLTPLILWGRSAWLLPSYGFSSASLCHILPGTCTCGGSGSASKR
jgi:hypothetical protein